MVVPGREGYREGGKRERGMDGGRVEGGRREGGGRMEGGGREGGGRKGVWKEDGGRERRGREREEEMEGGKVAYVGSGNCEHGMVGSFLQLLVEFSPLLWSLADYPALLQQILLNGCTAHTQSQSQEWDNIISSKL